MSYNGSMPCKRSRVCVEDKADLTTMKAAGRKIRGASRGGEPRI